jgi:hypothetical protein
MRYWKRPEVFLPRRGVPPLARSFLAAAMLLAAPSLQARSISIEYAGSELVEDSYYADARIQFNLDEEIFLALEHGVAVDIHTLLRVRRERKWLWDPMVSESRLHYRLQHHPLSDDYVVTEETSGERHQFPTVETALKFLSNVNNRRLVDTLQLEAGSSYTGYIKVRLSMESLPAPLQPAAYGSGRWQIESSWYEWVVR